MLEFVKAHWKLIIIAIIWIVELLVFLITTIKNKKFFQQANSHLDDVLLWLPSGIIQAELSGASGEDKLTYVFNMAIKRLNALTGIDAATLIDRYGTLLLDAIEQILLTPQKKG